MAIKKEDVDTTREVILEVLPEDLARTMDLWGALSKYIGKITKIACIGSYNGIDSALLYGVYWPLSHLSYLDEQVIAAPTPLTMGAVCKICGYKNDYLPVNPDHVCAICKSWDQAWSG